MPRVLPQATETRLISCRSCREAKVKCLAVHNERLQQPCRRCARKGLNCERRVSKRQFVPKRPGGEGPPTKYATATSSSSPPSHGQSLKHGALPTTSRSQADSENETVATSTSSSLKTAPARLNVSTATQAMPVTDPGLPSLSNPFKLLFQASNDEEQQTMLSVANTPASRAQQASSSSMAQAVEASDLARWRTLFSAGLYQPRYEPAADYSPVTVGIVTQAQAQTLFFAFRDKIDTQLDPELHTFDYIAQHPFLSATIYLIAAKLEAADDLIEQTDTLCQDLENHLFHALMPAIIRKGFRSMEIALGLCLNACFFTSDQYIYDDRSWQLIGQAIRIATELDMNSRIISKYIKSADERVQRHYRAQERIWVNVWLAERSIALGAGRRPCLATEGLIEDLLDWHKSPISIRGDTAMVAHVRLRRLYWSLRSMFNRLSAKQTPLNQGLSREDLDFFLAKVEDELRAWSESWNDSQMDPDRAHRLELYSSHVKVMLFSMPLQSTSGDIRSMAPAICGLYEATLSYLSHLNTADVNRLRFSHNSVFMIGTYVAVMAIKLTSLQPQFPWIDVERLIKNAEGVAILFMKAGWRKSKTRRKAVACHFGAYLEWLLRRYGMREHLHGLAQYREKHDQDPTAQQRSLMEGQRRYQQEQEQTRRTRSCSDAAPKDAFEVASPHANPHKHEKAAVMTARQKESPFLLSPSTVFGLFPDNNKGTPPAFALTSNATETAVDSAASSSSGFLFHQSDSSFTDHSSPNVHGEATTASNNSNFREMWGDQIAFSADFDVLSWAQRFLSENSS